MGWCLEGHLVPSKHKTVILSRKRNPSCPDLFFGSTKINLSEKMEVLGLCIDIKLTWTSYLSNMCLLDNVSEHCSSQPTSLIWEAEPVSTKSRSGVACSAPGLLDECLTNISQSVRYYPEKGTKDQWCGWGLWPKGLCHHQAEPSQNSCCNKYSFEDA